MTNHEKYKNMFDMVVSSEMRELEVNTMQEEIHAKRRGKMRGFKYYVKAAAIVLVLLVTSGGTAYAAANGYSLYELISVVFDHQGDIRLLEMSDVINVKIKKNTFKEVSITPVEAVSDGYTTYIALKIEGKDGYVLKEPVKFDFNMKDNEDSASFAGEKFIKIEDGAQYVAFSMTGNRRHLSKHLTYRITAYDSYTGHPIDDGDSWQYVIADEKTGTFQKAFLGEYNATVL